MFLLLSVSDSLWPHGLQHVSLLYSSLFLRVSSNLCPLSQWCFLTISFSAAPFSFRLHSFPASWSFPMNWLFSSGGQNIGYSTAASVVPVDIQVWFPLGLTGWSSSVPRLESISSSVLGLLYNPTFTSIQDYWKNHNFDYIDLCW